MISVNGPPIGFSRFLVILPGESGRTKLIGLFMTVAVFTAAPLSFRYGPAVGLAVSVDNADARAVREALSPRSCGHGRR